MAEMDFGLSILLHMEYPVERIMKFISRIFAKSAIRIRGGRAYCVKGSLMSRLLSDVSCLAAEFDLQTGEIWLNQAGKVSFSREIPKSVHQKIRNVISSH